MTKSIKENLKLISEILGISEDRLLDMTEKEVEYALEKKVSEKKAQTISLFFDHIGLILAYAVERIWRGILLLIEGINENLKKK